MSEPENMIEKRLREHFKIQIGEKWPWRPEKLRDKLMGELEGRLLQKGTSLPDVIDAFTGTMFQAIFSLWSKAEDPETNIAMLDYMWSQLRASVEREIDKHIGVVEGPVHLSLSDDLKEEKDED